MIYVRALVDQLATGDLGVEFLTDYEGLVPGAT